MTKKKKAKKKSICGTCFPCFGTAPIECEELMCPGFRSDISEFEYVVENMAISKVPKKLLNEALAPTQKDHINTEKDFSGCVTRNISPETSIGPVVYLEDVCFEKSSTCNLCEDSNSACESTQVAAPICAPYDSRPLHKRPGVARTFRAETIHTLDDDAIKELLIPHTSLYQDNKLQQAKILADIHKDAVEDVTKSVQVIPTDIRETIEALKVAKPLHIGSEFPPTNHRILNKSSSNTSFDKETLCNFSDVDVHNQTPSKIKRWHIPRDKIDASSSTSDFLDNVECNENTSSDLQSSEKTDIPDSLQGQSLKWKIIINKHKEGEK